MNLFACFFYKNLLTCWFQNPRRKKMAHSHKKISGCSHSSRFYTCLITDLLQIEVVRKLLGDQLAGYRGMAVFPQQYICIWAYIFKSSQTLNRSCLSPTFVKIFFPIEHMKFKGPSIRIYFNMICYQFLKSVIKIYCCRVYH